MAFENLEARLRLDSDQFTKSAESASGSLDGLAKKAERVGSRMQSAGTKMSLGITAPLVGLAGLSIKAASDVEELQSKTSVVFGDMTQEIQDWSAETAEAMGRSRFEIEKTTTSFADLFKPMGATTEEAGDMAKQLAVLTEDLASFNNMPSAQVQENLFAAMTGSSEAVKKYGVDVSQAQVEQELLNMGIEGGAEAATRMQEAQARLNIIMRETADAQGDAVRTADSFANQMKAMKAGAGELAVEFGNILLPYAQQLVSAVNDLTTRFRGLSDSQKRLVVLVAGVAAAIGPLLFALGTLVSLVPTVVAGAGAIGTALTLMTGPVGIVILALAALAAAFATDFMGIRTTTTEAASGIMQTLAPLIQMLRVELVATLQHLQNVTTAVLGFIQQLWSDHGEAIMSIVRPIFDILVLIVENALDVIITTIRLVLALIRGDWEAFGEILTAFLERLWGRVTEIFQLGLDLLVNLVSIGIDVIKAIFQAYVDFVVGVFTWLWTTARRLFTDGLDAVRRLVREKLEQVMDFITSLPDRFLEAGKAMMTALYRGITDKAQKVIQKARDVAQRVRNLLPFSDAKEGPLSDLTAQGRALPLTFAEGISQREDAPARAASEMADMPLGAGTGSGPSAAQVVEVLIEMSDDAEDFVDTRINRQERAKKRRRDNRGIRQ